MSETITLQLKPSMVKKFDAEASERAIANYGLEDAEDWRHYENLEWNDMSWEFDEKKDVLNVFGTVTKNSNEFGWISVDIPINNTLSIELIDSSIKKLQKLKAVLEATK